MKNGTGTDFFSFANTGSRTHKQYNSTSTGVRNTEQNTSTLRPYSLHNNGPESWRQLFVDRLLTFFRKQNDILQYAFGFQR
jgi:hypothetical protein